MCRQPVLRPLQRAHAEDHVGVQVRLAGEQIADHIGTRHLIVHRVGLDVLVVEIDTPRRDFKTAQSLRYPPRSRLGGDLGRGEVADGCPAQFAALARLRRGHIRTI